MSLVELKVPDIGGHENVDIIAVPRASLLHIYLKQRSDGVRFVAVNRHR